jgi:pantetheine-phosphate adenylyltransferase
MKKALFAGSFDPLTLGHLDIIKRAAKLFDVVLIGVGQAQGKSPYFDLAERLAMIKKATQEISNISIVEYSGLTVDFARKHGVVALIRGVRSVQDYSYELQMAQMNHTLDPRLDTVIFPTLGALSHISSSMARELAAYQGDITHLVPKAVVEGFRAKGWTGIQ